MPPNNDFRLFVDTLHPIVSKCRQKWFFTQTLSPEFYDLSILGQLHETFNTICRVLLRCGRFSINVELTAEGNIHYHGVLWIFDRDEHFCDENFKYLSDEIGFNKIDKRIKSMSDVSRYCDKDIAKMQTYFSFLPRQITEYNFCDVVIDIQLRYIQTDFEDLDSDIKNAII